jgi:hypothetical protein
VQVTIFAATQAEKDALISEATKTLVAKLGSRTTKHFNDHVTLTTNGSHSVVTLGNRTHVVVGGDQHARLWWMNGWLFLFKSTGSEDPGDFAEDFVVSIPHVEGPGVPVPVKAPL